MQEHYVCEIVAHLFELGDAFHQPADSALVYPEIRQLPPGHLRRSEQASAGDRPTIYSIKPGPLKGVLVPQRADSDDSSYKRHLLPM